MRFGGISSARVHTRSRSGGAAVAVQNDRRATEGHRRGARRRSGGAAGRGQLARRGLDRGHAVRQVEAGDPTAPGIVARHSPEMAPSRVGPEIAAVTKRLAGREPAATCSARQHSRVVAAHGARRGDLLNRLEVVHVHAQDSTLRPPARELRLRNSSGRTGGGWPAAGLAFQVRSRVAVRKWYLRRGGIEPLRSRS